jgi:hypothetical protein
MSAIGRVPRFIVWRRAGARDATDARAGAARNFFPEWRRTQRRRVFAGFESAAGRQ